MIHTGDCIEVMRTLPADSVDAVVTDPPYALAFMSKKWDAHPSPRSFMEWCTEWGREALRVTKPGGYLLAFGGTRTHHRLVCGLEDAGWIIRDELDWIYASGFPKGKANLKPAHEPIVLARKPGPLRPLNIEETRIASNGRPHRTKDDGDWVRPDGPEDFDHRSGMAVGTTDVGRWPSNLLLSDPELFDEPNPWIVGSGATAHVNPPGRRSTSNHTPAGDFGLGPRIPYGYDTDGGYSRFFVIPKSDRADREPIIREPDTSQRDAGDGQSLTAASHNAGPAPQHVRRANHHPTVKPTDLMRHLVRLVTPSGGTVLDPFLGSGSTAIACELEGFPWIGIEKEPEYVAIAEARLNGTQRGLGLDTPLVGEPRKTIGGQAPASGPTLTGESTSNSRGKFNGVEATPFYGLTREQKAIERERLGLIAAADQLSAWREELIEAGVDPNDLEPIEYPDEEPAA